MGEEKRVEEGGKRDERESPVVWMPSKGTLLGFFTLFIDESLSLFRQSDYSPNTG